MYSTFTRDKKCSLLLQKADITTTATAPKQKIHYTYFNLQVGEKLTGRLVAGMKAWHAALINYTSDAAPTDETELGAGFFKPGGEPNIPSQVHDVVIVNQVCGV